MVLKAHGLPYEEMHYSERKVVLVIVREELSRYGFNNEICADRSPKRLHGDTGLRIKLEVSK